MTLTAICACADSNAPETVGRRYELASYAGLPLPVVLRQIVETPIEPGGPTTSCDDELTASTVQLLGSNRFVQTDSSRIVCDDGRSDAASQDVLQGTYAAGPDTVAFAAELGDGAHYAATARFTPGFLTIYRRKTFVDGGISTTDVTELVFRAR